MKQVAMYMHGGSENHGCEAIVRSTVGILGQNAVLFSNHPEMDKKYGIDEICVLRDRGPQVKRFSVKWFTLQFKRRVLKNTLAFIQHNYSLLVGKPEPNTVYFSIGGDNYCGSLVPALKYVNGKLEAGGATTVLWGCSIDPEYISDIKNHQDLHRYKRIFARERVTYDALMEAGFGDIARYHPDPAFTLGVEKWDLPDLFRTSDVVGINISPYAQKSGSGDQVYENYAKLIEYILDNTNDSIALIPHVIWEESDDRVPLGRLHERFSDSGRVVYIEDQNCMRLKYCISQCSMLVAARTHASIAGYSTCVPTLVVGYSMKSRGIAEDLFGTTEGYVVNAWDMETQDALLKAFVWQRLHREEIEAKLREIIPAYIENAYAARTEIHTILD